MKPVKYKAFDVMNSALSKGIYKILQAHHFRAKNRAMHALKQSTPRTQKEKKTKTEQNSIKLCYNARVSSLQNRPHPYPFHHRSKHREIFHSQTGNFSNFPYPPQSPVRHRHLISSHLSHQPTKPNLSIYLYPSFPFLHSRPPGYLSS